jgi:hypothetical protein
VWPWNTAVFEVCLRDNLLVCFRGIVLNSDRSFYSVYRTGMIAVNTNEGSSYYNASRKTEFILLSYSLGNQLSC